MRGLAKKPFVKPVVLYLAVSLSIVWSIPAKSFAFIITSIEVNDLPETYEREMDLGFIQKELESKIVSERLKSFGITPDEIKERLEKLSNEDIHRIATQIESLKAGGGGSGLAIALLLLIVFILLLIQITGRKIIIQ